MGLILRSPDILLRLGQSLFMPVILIKLLLVPRFTLRGDLVVTMNYTHACQGPRRGGEYEWK